MKSGIENSLITKHIPRRYLPKIKSLTVKAQFCLHLDFQPGRTNLIFRYFTSFKRYIRNLKSNVTLLGLSIKIFHQPLSKLLTVIISEVEMGSGISLKQVILVVAWIKYGFNKTKHLIECYRLWSLSSCNRIKHLIFQIFPIVIQNSGKIKVFCSTFYCLKKCPAQVEKFGSGEGQYFLLLTNPILKSK